ncbi:MAG TPA: hypothetical protein VNL37_06730, partial [Candidatus Polarisedimenticolia bacterium]|nr:hypothetical protein [Candidatus Polarisedimenticolia bacterium]
DDLAPFVIGDAGYRALYAGRAETATPSAPGARLLVREGPAGLRAALYYPDALVRHLERHPPLSGLGDVNIDAFSAFVEEIDHLLTLACRAAERRPISLLELEHHANVTKYLVVVHVLGRQLRRRRIPEALRLWARHHLFEKYAEGGEDGQGQDRYRQAARLARRYVLHLERLTIEARRCELQTLQRRPLAETLRLAGMLN